MKNFFSPPLNNSSVNIGVPLLASKEALNLERGKEVTRFALTGIANTAIDWSVYFALTRSLEFFSDGVVLAKIIGFMVATIFSFMVHRYWTFGRTGAVNALEFVRFYLTVGTSLVLNAYSMYIFLPLVSGNDIAALVLATIITAAWNYFFLKFWVYEGRPTTT